MKLTITGEIDESLVKRAKLGAILLDLLFAGPGGAQIESSRSFESQHEEYKIEIAFDQEYVEEADEIIQRLRDDGYTVEVISNVYSLRTTQSLPA